MLGKLLRTRNWRSIHLSHSFSDLNRFANTQNVAPLYSEMSFCFSYTSSDPSLRSAAVEGLQATQAQEAADFQAQQAALGSFTTRDTFNFVEADAFSGLEQLLGVLN
jgi:hypothetical protein